MTKSEPIRVLQVIGIMNRGGAETMLMNLYRTIDRSKVQFDFVVNSEKEGFFDNEIRWLGGQIFHCPRFNGKNIIPYLKWWDTFFDDHPEYRIIHGHIGSSAALYLGCAKRHSLYIIAHSHSTNHYLSFSDYLYSAASFPVRNIADFFLVCSSASGISRYGKKTVKAVNKCKLFPNAIETRNYQYSTLTRGKVRKSLGVEGSNFLIGHVGRLSEPKNHKFLLEVFDEIHKNDKSTKLVLVGDGELRSQIEQQIVDKKLSNSVIMTGMRNDVNEMMQAFDLLLFPSLYEGLPVTLVEAQTTGLPCLISDIIPRDSILISDLVTTFSLSRSAEEWADKAKEILQRQGKRKDYVKEVSDAGFDVHKTAEWLEEFYLKNADK